jgi:DNA-binding transcriptional ArsR family regulator
MPKSLKELQMATLFALAEPTRMKIVELLRDGPLTVGEIADRLDLRQPQASKHLKVLADAGVLEVKADGNRRIYQLRSEPFQALGAWAKSFLRVMEERYDQLEAYLRELEPDGTP